jgi:AcrR family transcriptional regulator
MPTRGEAAAKRLRRDAICNRERVVESALVVIAREGLEVPVARIAAEAGVGVGTFYRSFADRGALIRELQMRAYESLISILETITGRGETGLSAIESYLTAALAISNRLILPLHGIQPLVDGEAVARRERIYAEIEDFLSQAREAGQINSDVNATDVIICSALITQAFQFGPDWIASATRHIRLFVSGITTNLPLPESAVTRSQVESAFASRAEHVHFESS